MSLTWSLIAGFLYTEVFIVLLLVLPLFSASKWNRFFKSRFLAAFARQAQIYFYLVLGVLVIFLLEAIREMRKYSNVEEETTLNLGMQHSMRLFRAQRNFYISGFAIFLSLVIRRLIILISQQASLIANSEASMRQAQSASDTARHLLAASGGKKKTDEETKVDEVKAALEDEVKKLKDELKRETKDKEALKSQAESLNREYDRLTEEFSKLQNKMSKAGGDKSD
ncbi:CLUMA_CG017430, isoform A [Clunio marinus]|uniref:Endoplasmic reticulum transmembrane protein n=1 Tax=Clunio marinus TaxID=568069 RepID=A0A1J1J0H0_9DIPT|nr:CLUMA_CG017430, isoform A [Clunio marinus]